MNDILSVVDIFDEVVGRTGGRIWGGGKQRHSRVVPIVGEERGEGGGGMLGVVISKLCHRQKSRPIRLLVVGVNAQVLL